MHDYSQYTGFDIIGDVHGYYDKLEGLLLKLGYHKLNDGFVHDHRLPIFVGDLIDRGPKQLQTVNTVRYMVEHKQALCIMGNHEFNAISYFTKDIDGKPLRALSTIHKDPHYSFLETVGDNSATHKNIIQWFKSLPIYLKLDKLCIVHACYDEQALKILQTQGLSDNNCLNDNLIYQANIKGTDIHKAIEVICKGPELNLPDNKFFIDKDGKKRNEVRIKWWLTQASSFKELAIIPNSNSNDFANININYTRAKYLDELQICIGHYWLNASNGIAKLSDNVICTDYSVAANGPLVAYRYYFEDKEVFLNNRFVSF